MKWWNGVILSIFVTLTTIYNLKTFKSVSPAWVSPRVQICIPKCSNPGIKPRSPALQVNSLPSHKESPKILEWVAYPFCSRPSWPRNWTRVSWIAGRFFTKWAIMEAPKGLLLPWGIKPQSPTWQTRILTTILTRKKNYNLKALKSASLTWLSFLGSIFVSPDASVIFHLDVKESQNFSMLKLNSKFSPTNPLSQICFLSKK